MNDSDWALALYVAARYLRKEWDETSSVDAILTAFDKARGVPPEDYAVNHTTSTQVNIWGDWAEQVSAGEVSPVNGFVTSLSESQAIDTINAIMDRFGFAGTFFTRADAEVEWQAQTRTDENGDEMNTNPMPEEVWDSIQNEWFWNDGLKDSLTESGWEIIYSAVRHAIEEAEDTPW